MMKRSLLVELRVAAPRVGLVLLVVVGGAALALLPLKWALAVVAGGLGGRPGCRDGPQLR